MMVAHNQSQQNETSGDGMRVARKGNGTGAAYVVLAALAALAGGGASTLSEMGMMPATAGWHAVVQAHPVLMLLYVVVPALLGGFGSLWLPRAVQRSGVLLPRLNDAGFLCVFAGAALTVTGAELKTATLLWCVGTLMTSMALLATVFDSRADMDERKPFSPFVWGEMLAAAVMLLTVPVMAGQIVKHWHDATAVNVESFAGPVGLVVLLAGFGVVFEISARVGKFSEKPVAFIMAAAAASGVVAWTKSVFMQGTESAGAMQVGSTMLALCSFAATCLAVLWLAGAWNARATLRVPLLWGLGFMSVVSGGWLVQLVQGNGLHSALQLGALYVVCGGFYLWRGEECGYWYPQLMAYLHFACTAVATALVFVPGAQMASGAFFGLAALCFIGAVVVSFQRNQQATAHCAAMPVQASKGYRA